MEKGNGLEEFEISLDAHSLQESESHEKYKSISTTKEGQKICNFAHYLILQKKKKLTTVI